MPAPYPHTIQYAPFNPPSALVLAIPDDSLEEPLSGSVGCPRKEKKKLDPPKLCSAARIWLQVVNGPASATSYKATDPHHADILHNDPSRFCFAPMLEKVDIHWEHEHPQHIHQSILEIYYLKPGGGRRRLWRKTFTWNNCPLQGKTHFDGDLQRHKQSSDLRNNAGLATSTLDPRRKVHAGRFSGGCVTAEFSPYQLRLTIVPKPGAQAENASVWMYFDVQLGGIQLRWCDPAHVDSVLPHTRLAENRAIFDALTDATDADNLNGALPAPGQLKKVYLQSNTFYKDTAELTNHTYYDRYRALWGDGPVIPIFADVLVLDSARNPVRAPLAVGKHRFMWEWVDRAEPHWPGGDANISAFMDTTRNYKAAATADSPAGMNCHVDRGGKRGPGARTCFPAQAGFRERDDLAAHDGTDEMLPFTVEPLNRPGSPFAATRRWCAYSEAWGSGLFAGQTGVLFQPSRMAGDGYELHVYAAYTSDAELENQVTPGNMPAGLHAATGTFQVWRQVDVLKHWVVRTTSPRAAPVNVAAIEAKFAHYHVKLARPARHTRKRGTWFATLTQVCNGALGPPLPEHIREAIDPTQRGHLITTKTYDQWLTRMTALHGVGNALYTWAENVPNYVDLSGNTVWSSWESSDGNNGMTPLMRPWPLQEDPVDRTDQGTGTVVVEFLDVNQSVPLTFDAPGSLSHRGSAVTPAQENTLRNAVSNAICTDLETNFGHPYVLVSYQHPRCPSRLDHRPLRYRLRGRAGSQRHDDRLANVRAALERARDAAFKESSKSTYEQSILRLGWVFIVFDTVMDAQLTAQFGARSGIVVVQLQDLSNGVLPAGKAFYANAAGDRALAACLATPAQQRTLEHEFGHALFLNHTYLTQPVADPNFFHQTPEPTVGPCIMHVGPTAGCTDACVFCGFCQARLSGWSALTVDPATDTTAPPRTLYYDANYNQHPGAPGGPVPHPTTIGAHHNPAVV